MRFPVSVMNTVEGKGQILHLTLTYTIQMYLLVKIIV